MFEPKVINLMIVINIWEWITVELRQSTTLHLMVNKWSWLEDTGSYWKKIGLFLGNLLPIFGPKQLVEMKNAALPWAQHRLWKRWLVLWGIFSKSFKAAQWPECQEEWMWSLDGDWSVQHAEHFVGKETNKHSHEFLHSILPMMVFRLEQNN